MKSKIKNTLMLALISGSALLLNACGSQPAMVPNAPVFQTQPMHHHMSRQNSIQQMPQEILVRFAPDAPRHALAVFADKYQVKITGYLQELDVYVYQNQISMTQQGLQQMLVQMNHDATVHYAEINHKIEITPIFN